ncbi:MAG: putative Ig domain-containing protein [Candidatus Thiodiazotropha taylori]|nr:putative Ig domain-containing protein [Candidatus Thiodiazotropha taylori]MCG7973211.1 putative Ig domain-containing protein [Candidatus Thiodiazotropha taylori]
MSNNFLGKILFEVTKVMNATRKFLLLVLFPALFSAQINLAQAADLSISKAIWRGDKDKLVIKGLGEPGTQVNAYAANSILPIGTATVNKRGAWRIKQISPPFVPCDVDVVSGTDSTYASIRRAPSDCFAANEEPDQTPENTPPVISGSPNTQVAEGQAYSFRPTAVDEDNDSLTFSITNRPTWASFNSSTGLISGTPGMDDAGTTSNIRISVSDGSASASLSAFSITVSNTNRAPTISGAPTTSVDEGSAYSFTPTASDPDGDALSFSVSNLPNWASFRSSIGQISGTPDSNSAGNYSNIVITVSDGSQQVSLAPFAITVADVAEEGGTFQFASNNYDVEEGSTVTLTVTRDNGKGAATVNYGTYGVEATHSQDYTGYVWTALNFLEGETSKTIRINTMSDTTDEGSETFEVHLNDPSEGYSLINPSVSIVTIHNVDAPNNAPFISGTPDQSVLVGDGYVFTPTATDDDNDTLTFSISNLPSWAYFDSSDGTLSGTPEETDEGHYSNIVITVTDGTDSASLSPLTLVVEASQATPTTGSISLNWVAPATRTDGSSLDMSEISGYRLYMGTSSSNLTPVVDVDDCTINDHVIENLETGTYYFAITAYDLSGNESDLSNVVAKETM